MVVVGGVTTGAVTAGTGTGTGVTGTIPVTTGAGGRAPGQTAGVVEGLFNV